VYSNFKGKDDLFLAVLDAEAQRPFPLHTELMQQAGEIEEGLRASAREMAECAHQHPGWTGVYVEFWTHASRRPELRRRVAEQPGPTGSGPWPGSRSPGTGGRGTGYSTSRASGCGL
jgi:AcrR family transcriptional regulator